MKTLEIEIFGRVQGIGFRASIKRKVVKFGLNGYVKNRFDGSVFLILQGEEEKIQTILDWIQKNPGFSKISGVRYNWIDSDVNYSGFEIRKDSSYLIDKIKSVGNLIKSVRKVDGEIPEHVALIPDGNRRWAKERGLHPSSGHYNAGNSNHIESLLLEAKRLGVKYFTIWGFSTENWKRDEREIKAIFNLLLDEFDKLRKMAMQNNLRFVHIGRKDRIPKDVLEALNKLESETKEKNGMSVQLCIDYGGKDEIVRVVNKLIESGRKNISEEEIDNSLDSKGIPEIDLIIRTSGEHRISGFMPLQSSYAELYFSEAYFPDFGVDELRKAIAEFTSRKRRFGK